VFGVHLWIQIASEPWKWTFPGALTGRTKIGDQFRLASTRDEIKAEVKKVDEKEALDSVIGANGFSIFRQHTLTSIRLLQPVIACAIAFHVIVEFMTFAWPFLSPIISTCSTVV
jgi:hypothetical protein